MIDVIAILWVVTKLSARARKKGYPSFVASLGVLGWVGGEVLGFYSGARLGLELGALFTSFAGGVIAALLVFALFGRLPDRTRQASVGELEEAFR